MDQIKSFDIDLAGTFADGGAAAAAAEIARSCFGCDIATEATAEDLLAELRRPEIHATVEWNQDTLLSAPEVVSADLIVIARENQANWQAVQRSDGLIDIGGVSGDGWETGCTIGLGDLLLRMLAMEAIVGHGPFVESSEILGNTLQPFELLPRLEVWEGAGELFGVAATDNWFGVFNGVEEQRFLYASPADQVQRHFARLNPDVSWSSIF